jgi:hypothetical protein
MEYASKYGYFCEIFFMEYASIYGYSCEIILWNMPQNMDISQKYPYFKACSITLQNMYISVRFLWNMPQNMDISVRYFYGTRLKI